MNETPVLVGEVCGADFEPSDWPNNIVLKVLLPKATRVGHWFVRIETFPNRSEAETPWSEELIAAAKVVVREWRERGDGGCQTSVQELLRAALEGVENQ